MFYGFFSLIKIGTLKNNTLINPYFGWSLFACAFLVALFFVSRSNEEENITLSDSTESNIEMTEESIAHVETESTIEENTLTEMNEEVFVSSSNSVHAQFNETQESLLENPVDNSQNAQDEESLEEIIHNTIYDSTVIRDNIIFRDNLREEENIPEENYVYNDLYDFRDVIANYSLPYDESASASLFDKVKQVDNALLQAMRRLDIPLSNFRIESTSIKIVNETYYLYQKIYLYLTEEISIEQWRTTLSEQIVLWAHNTRVEYTESNEKLSIYIDNQLTHEIYLNKTVESAQLSIVIDDLGENPHHLTRLMALDFPVTLSILPHTPHAEYIATVGHFSRREVFLHQPMEAQHSAYSVPEGLYVNDSQDTIKEKLEENLARVPFASGINNHTGSAFTADSFAVSRFLSALKEVNQNINILDSVTINGSHLARLAENASFQSDSRNVFLDNVRDVEEITHQLDYALNLALERNTHIIAIGHPYSETLQALQDWHTYRDKNVEIVHVF